MTVARQLRYSYEDYLRALDDSAIKLEYSAGVIYAMAGGTLAHAELSAAAIGLLRQALPPGCTVFSSDAKVRVEASDFAGFPDVSVVCGERQTSRIDPNALVNPSLLVEVTSRSTEDYDRGEKLLHYQRLPSVRAVLFISHRERRVTVVERSANGWETRDVGAGQQVVLTDPSVRLDVDALYGTVALEP
ncbi:MAG: Uma2 family endonuclease [Myxococcota bacterium]